MYQYRYIVDGGKLVQLNGDTKDKYIGKVVNMRTPQFCTSEQICSKCAGELYYKLGIKNMGLTVTKISSTILNAGLKKMHDSSIKVLKMDYKKYMS